MELIEVDAGHVVFDAADPLGNEAGVYISKKTSPTQPGKRVLGEGETKVGKGGKITERVKEYNIGKRRQNEVSPRTRAYYVSRKHSGVKLGIGGQIRILF